MQALIGVLWEFFEFLFDTFVASRTGIELAGPGLKDLLGDLFFDLLGGFVVTLMMKFSYNKKRLA